MRRVWNPRIKFFMPIFLLKENFPRINIKSYLISRFRMEMKNIMEKCTNRFILITKAPISLYTMLYCCEWESFNNQLDYGEKRAITQRLFFIQISIIIFIYKYLDKMWEKGSFLNWRIKNVNINRPGKTYHWISSKSAVNETNTVL